MTALGITLACVVFVVLYVFSRVEFTTHDDAVRLRWVVLGAVPFGSRTLSTSDIEGVEQYSFKRHWRVRAQFFGSPQHGVGPVNAPAPAPEPGVRILGEPE